MSLHGRESLYAMQLAFEALLGITPTDPVIVCFYVFVFANVFVFVFVFQMSLDDMDLLESLQLASEALLGITQIDHPLSLFGQPTPTTLIYLF